MRQETEQHTNLSPEERRALLARMLRQQAQQIAPLSYMQEPIWFFVQFAPDSPFYNIPAIVHLEGPLDAAALEHSLQQLVRRHGALRTTIAVREGQPVQIVAPTMTVHLPVHDLQRLNAAAQEREVERLAHDDACRPFDLAHGPLARISLIRLGPDRHVLLQTMHHIIADGWSMTILVTELAALYHAHLAGTAATLPALPLQYTEYARWQRDQLSGARLQARLEYWRTALAGAPPMLRFYGDGSHHERLSGTSATSGERRHLGIDATLGTAVSAFSRRHNASRFVTMLAALYLTLWKWTGQHDIVIGTVTASRGHSDLESLIGCFINFLPLRTRIDGDGDGMALLKQVRTTVLEAYDHQDVPFSKIVEAVAPERSRNGTPIYNVALLFQNFRILDRISFGDTVHASFDPSATTNASQLDLRFVVTASDDHDEMTLECEYRANLFDAITIDQLLEAYGCVLTHLVHHPDTPMQEASIAPLPEAPQAAERAAFPLVVAATFTAEPLAEPLGFWMEYLDIDAPVSFAPYNHVFQQLLDPVAQFAQNSAGANVVLVRCKDWLRFETTGADPNIIARNANELAQAVRGAAARSSAPLIVCICPSSPEASHNPAIAQALRDADATLAALGEIAGVYVIAPDALVKRYPVTKSYDAHGDATGHIPYTPEMFSALATAIARTIFALRQPLRKVIALDADHTLWHGVCGEDGPHGVVVDGPWRTFQTMLVEQHHAGMLLCVCSKNAPEDVEQVFEQRHDMPLQREHLVAQQVNWQPKSHNLRTLANQLQLGLDSFIFIDDNPVECAEVRTNCPEVLVLQLPADAERIDTWVQHVWAFDHLAMTAEDRKRTALYQQNAAREAFRAEQPTFADFLAGLELQITIQPTAPSQYTRIAQLTQRTNQFNCTTIRRTEGEIAALCQRDGTTCFAVEVGDRFGDYGLVGTVIVVERPDTLHVDTLLLSCRVLGRSVEHRLLAWLAERATEHGRGWVEVGFAPTARNEPAQRFLAQVAASAPAHTEVEQANGTLYRFAAPDLSSLAYPATAVPADAREDAPRTDAATATDATATAHLLQHIASDLATPQAVLEHSNRRRRAEPTERAPYVAPRTPLEEQVAAIWGEVLGVEHIGVDDDFFALGGHSLRATQVVSRLYQEFEVALDLPTLFDATTVATLAVHIAAALPDTRADTTTITPAERDGALVISYAQQRLWFLDQLDPGSAAYNNAMAVHVAGTLELDLLTTILNAVVERHESLRTRFVADEGRPMQVVEPSLHITPAVDDLRAVPDAERAALVKALIRQETQQPFALATGPLMRVRVIQTGEHDAVVVLTIHHIVSDGWSMGVLMRDIGRLYARHIAGEALRLPPLPVQYADWSAWQRDLLAGERQEQQLAYWRRQLAGSVPALDLPTDRARPVMLPSRSATYPFTIPAQATADLAALSREENSTLFMSMLAAFQVLLHRYAGQRDVLVGTPIANRAHAQTEDLIGFFVNTLVMRADVEPTLTFRQFLRQVRRTALDAYAHQDVPFEMLVEVLQPQRDLSRTPLFQVMFAFQNTPLPVWTFPGLTLTPLDIDAPTAPFDLSLVAWETPDGIAARLEYHPDLFDAATMEHFVEHYCTLLHSIVAAPDCPLAALRLLPEAEQHRIVHQWSSTEPIAVNQQLVHQQVCEQAARTPHAVALVHDDRHLTYHDLDLASNRLAHLLLARGIGLEHIVAICMERSSEMIASVLGVLKAGAAYLPLDPDTPAERLRFILDDARATAILTQPHLAHRLPDGATVVPITLDHLLDGASDDAPAVAVDAQNAAYIIYTSGSTGTPKGVVVPHGALTNYAAVARRAFSLAANDRVLQFASLSFDASAEEIYPTLTVGATLVLRPATMLASFGEFLATCERMSLTVLDLPTAYWHDLVAAVETERLCWPPDVRLVVIGGERVLPQRCAQWFRIHPTSRLVNTYGPTEATIVATSAEITAALDGREIVIGRPIPNAEALLLDPNLQPVPVGVVGELFLSGVGLARGYLARPDLTADRFVPHPWSSVPGARLYRTGDRARFRADGTIEYAGRADDQIKVRGFRVELGDIESTLVQHPDVQQAAAIAHADGARDKRLIAYVVAPAIASAALADTMRTFLKERLPAYMVPSIFIALDTLPRTVSGKIDRRALPAPDLAQRHTSVVYVAPRTPIERTLAEQWSAVLHVEQIGTADNFFELGGHSLLATQLMSRLRVIFDIDIPLRLIFESPTVAEQARAIEEARQHAGASQIPPLEPTPHAGDLPLSFAQQRLWVLNQLEPHTSTYNISDAAHVAGPLDLTALQNSLSRLMVRHEALRTTFHLVDGVPVQRIMPAEPFVLTLRDIGALDGAERDHAIQHFVTAEAQRPFDLQYAPLLRVGVLRLQHDEHVIVLCMHHIVFDDWSSGILVPELAALYNAAVAGTTPMLPDAPLQYADFALWQRRWLQGDVLAQQLAYWKTQLAGAAPTLDIPTDRPRPAVQSSNGAYVSVQIPDDVSGGLHRLCQQQGATIFMGIMATFQALLYRYTHQHDISIGTPIANRNHPGTETIIGFFVNTLVIRILHTELEDFRAVLAQVRETALDAYAHQDVPFEMVVDAVQAERTRSYSPLFQVMLVVQPVAPPAQLVPHVRLSSVVARSHTAKFDLTLFVQVEESRLTATFEYNADLFDHATIEQMSAHFVTLMTRAVELPDCPVAYLPILSTAELDQQRVVWNPPTDATDAPHPAHVLFAEQAARTPDAVALLLDDATMTYDELHGRSTRLACFLRGAGVGPEVVVGVCVERTAATIVALLAVMKAGGVYMPIDPTNPVERLRFMIADARLAFLIGPEAMRERLDADSVRIIDPALERDAIEGMSSAPFDSGVDAANAAYVIYTSGSTGNPKGVVVPHTGIGNLARAQCAGFGVGLGTRLLQFASLSFDASISDVFVALLSGATLCIASQAAMMPGEPLLDVLTRDEINVVTLLPSVAAMLPLATLPALRTLVVAGEACSPDVYQTWAVGRRFINAYGPTEGTVCATMSYDSPHARSIGRPIANVRVYILDAHLQPVPVGVTGELYIGGIGVARGYINRPDLTAERFIPDPFGTEPGARMYGTGDLARYKHDGHIEFLGRNDEQVKLRGYRIELGEIEAALTTHPAVREAVVVLREDTPGAQRLVAYVVTHDNTRATPDDLRQHLHPRLPAYMIPAAMVALDQMPLTSNQKIDRRALPRPRADSLERAKDMVEPRDDLERQVAEIWCNILQVERLSVTDTFFKLGGHSLSAVRLAARLQALVARPVPLALVFEHVTIAEQATALRGEATAGRPASVVLLRDGTSQSPIFLFHAAGGNVLCYLDLVQHLDPQRMCYGIQASDHDDLADIETLASHYVATIRRVQPTGPYVLLGWSVGGLLAFEVAQQLRALDQEVAWVGIVDSSADGSASALTDQALVLAFAHDLGINDEITATWTPNADADLLAHLWTHARHTQHIPADITLIQVRQWFAIFRRLVTAADRYRPQPYSGALTFFGTATDATTTATAWRRATGNALELEVVDGDHYTMVREPHATTLALRIENAIARVMGGRSWT